MNIDRFKYRVWDKYLKKMNYISLDELARDTYFWFDGETVQEYVFSDCLKEGQRFIIEQCTGIRDRSGRLIYENDLVKDVSEEIEEDMLVVFDEDDAMFAVLSSTTEYSFAHFYGEDLEIIGNIHENVDLLEDNAYGKPSGNNNKE